MDKEGREPEAILGVLLNLTEEQHQATAMLLEDLKVQIGQMRTAASDARGAASRMATSAQAVDAAAIEAMPVILAAVDAAVVRTVKSCLEGAAATAAKALDDASRPVLDRLAGVVSAAGNAERQLRRAATSLSWRRAALALVTTAAALLVLWSAISVYDWWQRGEVKALASQREALAAEILQLQANAEEWAKKAGRAKLERCGEQARLCVRVDTQQVYGKNGDYRYVLRGY